MPKARTLLLILATFAVLAVLVLWSWLLLRRHERLLLEATRRAEGLGRAEGASFDEDQCFEAALERSHRLPARALDDLLLNRLRFEKCLEASRFVPSFCDGVPPLEDPRATAGWQMDRSLRLSPPGRWLLVPVQRYCHSPERRGKADLRSPSGPI
jgi:hypothetical protein